jgi:hypothetical protein
MAAAHNVVLPFFDRGPQTWPQRNRDYLVRSMVERYEEEVEEARVRRQRANQARPLPIRRTRHPLDPTTRRYTPPPILMCRQPIRCPEGAFVGRRMRCQVGSVTANST